MIVVWRYILFIYLFIYLFKTPSGVTRVGDTRAATEGVYHPSIVPEKPGDLFLLIAVTITIAFYCFPLQGVTPHLFYLSDLVSPLFFVNLPTKFFFLRVSPPPGGCHLGRSAPPPSDATDYVLC